MIRPGTMISQLWQARYWAPHLLVTVSYAGVGEAADKVLADAEARAQPPARAGDLLLAACSDLHAEHSRGVRRAQYGACDVTWRHARHGTCAALAVLEARVCGGQARLPRSVLDAESILLFHPGCLLFWRGPTVSDDVKVAWCVLF